jgi:hypothetical protein
MQIGQQNSTSKSNPFNPNAIDSVLLENSLFVAKNGNNTTAVRNDLSKPYLTIGGAKADAQAGDTIYIFPGDYDEIFLFKADVNYHFFEGANINIANAKFQAPFTINAATNSTFTFDEVYINNTNLFDISGGAFGSKITINANKLEAGDNITPLIFSSVNNVNININCNKFYGGIFALNTTTYNMNINDLTNTWFNISNNIVMNLQFNVWGLNTNEDKPLLVCNNAEIYISGNYAIYNTSNSFNGIFELKGSSIAGFNIVSMFADGNNPIFYIDSVSGVTNFATLIEGFYFHSGTNAASRILYANPTANIILPQNITFKNFTGHVDNTVTNSIFSNGFNFDTKFYSSFSNKNKNANIISKIAGSPLRVDADV